MSINREKITTTVGAHLSLVEILSFIFFFLFVKSFEEEIQPSDNNVDTTRG